MRPILFNVDAVRGEMTIVKPGPPHRLATIQLRTPAATEEDALHIARVQFAEMTDSEFEQLFQFRGSHR